VSTVPITCTLTPDAVVDRMAEWRVLLSTMVERIDVVPTNATLTLVGGVEALVAATDLAERERACCAFFRFSLELDGNGTRLHIEVPAGAEEILTGLLQIGQAQLDME
jgi:hypothetical protein